MMKYNVKVGGKTYLVEIENINSRPIIAIVDGERFEAMPEITDPVETGIDANLNSMKKTSNPNPVSPAASSPNPAMSGNALTAPLPGTVVEVFVKAGDKVETGQVVLVIEAMKMKNSIRSVFSGTVSEVLVSAGQSVAHKQGLVKFANLGEAAWI
jgi:biotin carboxyl carrier protein